MEQDAEKGFIQQDEYVPTAVGVYAIVDERNFVRDLKSTIFYTPNDGDFRIAEGFGDTYVHVGEYINNVLRQPMYDDNFCCNFKIEPINGVEDNTSINGLMVERTEEDKDAEIAARPTPTPPVSLDGIRADVDLLSKTVSENDEKVSSLEADTLILAEAAFEADNKVSTMEEDTIALAQATFEIDMKVSTVEEDTIALAEAAFEADNKVTTVEEDSLAVATALFELDEATSAQIEVLSKKIAMIMENLGLTYPE